MIIQRDYKTVFYNWYSKFKETKLFVRMSETSMQEFGLYLAKWVRTDHVTTDEHWLNKPVIPNKLRES